MKNINEPAVLKEITGRINLLKPDSAQLWGKMNVAQMMAHCSNALEGTLGDRVDKHSFVGKIFGKIAKKSMLNEKPFKRNLPTAPSLVIIDSREFNLERQRLLNLLGRLPKTNFNDLTKNPHPFFGRLNAQEWNNLVYKHLDHHLSQFGV